MEEQIRVPKIVRDMYENGKTLLTQENPRIQNLQRCISIMTDVEAYRRHQEKYDRSMGQYIRKIFPQAKGYTGIRYHNIRKRKREALFLVQSDERESDLLQFESYRKKKKRKLSHEILTVF